MPFIQINVPTQLSAAVRSKLIQDVIDRTHEAVGSDPKIINVVIHELSPANISVGGKCPDEPWAAQFSSTSHVDTEREDTWASSSISRSTKR